MKLKQVRVRNYKCIEDSDWVDFDRVTCLVGKNESGKTAFLNAVEKLNPVDSEGDYVPLDEYPRRRYNRYKTRHEEDPDPVTSARYELSQPEISAAEEKFGSNVLNDSVVELTKYYQNQLHWEIDVDEEIAVQHVVNGYELHNKTRESLEKAETVSQLWQRIQSSESEADAKELPQLESKLEAVRSRGVENYIGDEILVEYLPQFLYFDDYSIMKGDVYINQLQKRANNGNFSGADETFLSLLSIAQLDLDDLKQMDEYEAVKAELEAASIDITNQVFEYWTQGPDLRVEFDKSDEIPKNSSGNNPSKQPVLHVRIFDKRHEVTLPFDERSRGFVWFFSFLAYFSDMESEDTDLILLLDEPGLNLHAKAQYDFLRFINERLAPSHQVIYTTHSPFMLEPKRLERARLVLDETDDELHEGTKISDDILKSDDDTIFPLQAVLGYDLIQTLLLGPECLLVEGKSDMIYLQVMSEILEQQDRESLSHRWTIVPVGGADNVPTFVSMFGASDLDIGVLLDADGKTKQRKRDIKSRGVLDLTHVKTVGEFIDGDEGDTEDLFSEDFYSELVSEAYGWELRAIRDIPDTVDLSDMEFQHPRVTKRAEKYFADWHINEGKFEHHKPAAELQRKRDYFEDKIQNETIDRFEDLFEELNKIIQ